MRFLFQYLLPPLLCGFSVPVLASFGLVDPLVGFGLVLAGVFAGILKTKYEARWPQ